MNSYRWSDVLNYVGQSNPRLTTDANGALIMDLVNSFIWGRADWRISLKKIAPFYMVPLQQDYVAPYINMPNDFLGLRSATLTYNECEPPTTYPPLMIDRYLSLTYAQTRPTSISYEQTTGGLRLYPRPPSGIGPMSYQVECTYKTNPVKVTSANLFGAMPFDDQYFNVFAEGCKYFCKPASMQSDQDLNRLIGMVDIMAAHEAINLGDMPLSPREPLVGW